VAAGLRVLVIANTTVPSRDTIVFVRYALDLGDPPPTADGQPGNILTVLRANEHPPGYPLTILAVAELGGQSPRNTSASAMGLSAQIASGVAGVLLSIPLYLLTRRILGRNAAFVATLVFGVLPGFVEVTSDGISDGLFWLTTVAALWFGVRAVEATKRRTEVWNGLGAGACCGLGYLVRPEGAAIALSIGVTLVGLVIVMWIRRRRTGAAHPVSPRLIAGFALIAGWLVTTLPYMVAIDGVSNKPTFRALFDRLRGREIDRTYFDRSFIGAGPRLPLAVWWTPDDAARGSKAVWATKALGSEYLKAALYVVPAFGLIGLYSLRRRLGDPRLLLLLVVAALQALMLWALALGIGYVSQRHTIIIVMITCIFAPEGFHTLSVWAIRAWQSPRLARLSFAHRMQSANPCVLAGIWTAIVIAIALPRNFRSLHEERAGHKAAGLWMKDHVPTDWQIVDPFGWAEWYTGRTLRAIPNPNPYIGPGLYAVFEPNAKSPHSKLGYYEMARDVKDQGQMVFQFPHGVSDDQIKVAVYKSPPLKAK
jgi:Dolichyl-phosphate-mannose-protein mannosyltransferase